MKPNTAHILTGIQLYMVFSEGTLDMIDQLKIPHTPLLRGSEEEDENTYYFRRLKFQEQFFYIHRGTKDFRGVRNNNYFRERLAVTGDRSQYGSQMWFF